MSHGSRPPLLPEESHEEPPTREDLPYVIPRLRMLFRLFAVVMVIFSLQIYKLSILKGPEYRKTSDNNFLLKKPLLPPRGRILDRLGRPMAINQNLFTLSMSPFRLSQQEIRNTLDQVARLIGRPEIAGKTAEVIERRPRWRSVQLADNLSMRQVLPVIERTFILPGVTVAPEYKRYYPTGMMSGVVTGHIGGMASREEQQRYLEAGYLRREKVGQLNAELTFEQQLHGQPGLEIVTRDARGRPISRYTSRAARPGHSIKLTIDLELQRMAYRLLEGWQGAILVMDPRDGAVLAMAARPTYDPNRPWRGMSFNKITQAGLYAPGSTFKIITASAGLSAGLPPSDRRYCDGQYHVPGVRARFPCHLLYGHGWENMYEALQHSCNVFFFNWAHEVGYQHMVQMAAAYGLGRRTGFELVQPGYESSGRLGHRGAGQPLLGNTLQMGIGQGAYITVTPIQMARAYAALCNGGVLYRPRILKEVYTAQEQLKQVGQSEVQGMLPLTEEQRRAIVEGLWRVIHERGGTADDVGFKPEWRVAGKTGTAQTHRKQPDAWFVCFAPVEEPEILVLVLVEQGGHGGKTAAPLARQILAHHFGEPEAEIAPPPQPEAEGTQPRDT